jgi:hypothetical protein
MDIFRMVGGPVKIFGHYAILGGWLNLYDRSICQLRAGKIRRGITWDDGNHLSSFRKMDSNEKTLEHLLTSCGVQGKRFSITKPTSD